jgi:uncharacterized delta-60 repeat protein
LLPPAETRFRCLFIKGNMKMKKISLRRFLFVAPFILLISLFAMPVLAAGEVDTSFVSTVSVTRQSGLDQVAVQPDGKIIIAGEFTVVGKYGRNFIARLNPDGTVDTTFNPVELRQTSSGSGYIKYLEVEPDGKIAVGGQFSIEGLGNLTFIKLNPDGSLDNPNLGGICMKTCAPLPDGKRILYNSSNFKIERYNPNNTIDNTFQSPFVSHSVLDVEVQADGKILIGGALSAVNNFAIKRIARLNPDGTIDSTFNIGTNGPNGTITDIEIQADGKILIGGDFTTFNGVPANRVARLNQADGSLDTSFNSGINPETLVVNDLDIQPDGKIVTASIPMHRLNTDGSIDSSFVSPVVASQGSVEKVLVQPDNKILVGGYFLRANEKPIQHLARFNADGTVDNTFNQTSIQINGQIFAIALQTDGKIIAGGNGFGGAVRLNSDGSFDKFFGPGAIVYDIKILPDGKILLLTANGVIRYNQDATQDATFTPAFGNTRVYRIAVLPDGKILMVGNFTEVGGTVRNRVARLNADGTLDASFNPPGGVNASVFDLAVQADGKIVIGGDFTGVNFDTTKKYLARLNADGTLDTSFESPALDTRVRTIRIEPSGKILIGGVLDSGFNNPPGKIARINPNGFIDPTFNYTLAINRVVNSIDLQSNGGIIIGGYFTRVGGVPNVGVARLLNSAGGSAPFDFDGDGKTDLSIFRAAQGEWWINRSANGSNYAAQFGSATDRLTPGDFTGDGKTDIAFFRPSTGNWFVLRSEDGSFYSFPFGANGDVPVVGDFDADGKDDAGVFRPSDSTWYIRRSSDGGTIIRQFGQSGDVPVTADYDGDGKADVAIFRPASGEWWIQRSTAGLIAFQFGSSADKPVQGDYTGDGKADVAFFRPSTSEWFVLRSENQTYYSFPFGAAGDVPAPGDYDGDGRFDATVFRPSTNTWYSQRTSAGTLIQSFGQAGDTPVPNAFVP